MNSATQIYQSDFTCIWFYSLVSNHNNGIYHITMSPEYILYSLDRSTDLVLSIWSLVNPILVVFYSLLAWILHLHERYYIWLCLYVYPHQDRNTKLRAFPRCPETAHTYSRHTPRGRQDNHSDTSCITPTLDGNHRPSDLLYRTRPNITPSYGKPSPPQYYGRPNVTHIHVCDDLYIVIH